MMNWFKRLMGGGSGSTATTEPETAPEPPTLPPEPDASAGEEDAVGSGDPPA
jgi:hypothetical protein